MGYPTTKIDCHRIRFGSTLFGAQSQIPVESLQAMIGPRDPCPDDSNIDCSPPLYDLGQETRA